MLVNESRDTIDDGRVEFFVVVDSRRHLLSDGRVLPLREETVENRTSPVGLPSRDSPKAAHQFRNVPQELAFANRGTIRVPRFPNGRLGKIVPPLFGGISFPSGSFAIRKRVLGIFFQIVPKEAVDFVLEINQVLSVAVEVDLAEMFCDEGKTPPHCGRHHRAAL